METLHEWNVVVSVRERTYREARSVLKKLGRIGKTSYHNILVLQVPDIKASLEKLLSLGREQPQIFDWIAHFIPVSHIFHYSSPEEFETKARQTALELLPQLANQKFHVRMQRRGFKERIEASYEERILGELILAELEKSGTPGQINFAAPDAVLIIETVGQQAGLAVWKREDFERYPFLQIN